MSKGQSQPRKVVEFKPKSEAAAGNTSSSHGEECPKCAASRQECETLQEQRDDALKALAEERETSNALRLGHRSAYHYVGSHVRHRKGEAPLRYEVADAANELFKRYFGFVHAATRRAFSRLVQLGRILGRNIEP